MDYAFLSNFLHETIRISSFLDCGPTDARKTMFTYQPPALHLKMGPSVIKKLIKRVPVTVPWRNIPTPAVNTTRIVVSQNSSHSSIVDSGLLPAVLHEVHRILYISLLVPYLIHHYNLWGPVHPGGAVHIHRPKFVHEIFQFLSALFGIYFEANGIIIQYWKVVIENFALRVDVIILFIGKACHLKVLMGL